MKKIAITILFIILFTAIFSNNSCSLEEGNIDATEMPYSPIDLTLDISSMPSLGKTVELTFTIEVKDLWDSLWMGQTVDTISNAKASVDFFWTDIHGSYSEAKKLVQIPHEDVLVDGKLNWEGNALENREITLHSQIRLPKEGVWQIHATFSGQDWTSMPSFTKYIAVADGEAVNMLGGDLESSKLAYIDYFNYGHGGPKLLDENSAPIILELDISKAPRVGEEVLLTCRITSLHDVADFSAEINILKGIEYIKDNQLSSFLVDGDLDWEGDLKQMTPVEVSAVIKFPEEGEWRIYAEGNSLLRTTEKKRGFVDSIKLTITDDKSYYGWKPLTLNRSNITGDDIPGISPFSEERHTFLTEAGKSTLLFSERYLNIRFILESILSRIWAKRDDMKVN